ncbi:MAG: VOC family protein [Gammaproteobacteria bacterium]|nr:VOC family protein [Gammaproteobacteria bacterium]
MKVKLSSIPVNDQDRAEAFYTDTLGFLIKNDIPLGEHRWLTVVSPDAPEETELLLEPNEFPPTKVYQSALMEAGIPWTGFASSDVVADYNRLKEKGVEFTGEPVDAGSTVIAVFHDTCGNLIQIYQV